MVLYIKEIDKVESKIQLNYFLLYFRLNFVNYFFYKVTQKSNCRQH